MPGYRLLEVLPTPWHAVIALIHVDARAARLVRLYSRNMFVP